MLLLRGKARGRKTSLSVSMFLALPVRLLDMEIVKQGVYFYTQTAADVEIVKQGVYILYIDCRT